MHYHEFFNDKSEIYRTARPIYPDGLIKKLSSLAQQHGLAWDCATGNGQAAIGLSEYFVLVKPNRTLFLENFHS